MLDWNVQASAQYGGQSLSLREWLGGIENRPSSSSLFRRDVCKACGNFDVTAASHRRQTVFSERYSRWDRRPAVADIRAAASGGCKRCEVLVQALHWLEGDAAGVNLKFLPTSVAMFTDATYLEVFPSGGEPSMACGFPPGLGVGRTRHADQTDAAFFEDITMAINDCIRNHPDCRSPLGTSDRRPCRLVEVPAQDGMPVRIVRAPPDVEYAALSHCWGTKPLKRLLKSDGSGDVLFAWEEIPASFRDACTVARNLFLQYVWIDSLCIIQDDGDDWEREAAKMGAIYEGAYVTISATGAAASVDGFLFPRYISDHFSAVDSHDRLVRFTVRKYNTDAPFSGRFPHYGDTQNHPWLMRANDMDTEYLNPIQLRGWCFQERLMSKRVLHFKRYEYMLECAGGYRCECSGMRDLRKGTFKSFLNRMLKEDVTPLERLTLEKLRDQLLQDLGRARNAPKELIHTSGDTRMMQMWEMLIELYSRTCFTYQDDVLPALASLARSFHDKRPEWGFLSGIWQENLHRGLLWIPHDARGFDGTLAERTKASRGDKAIGPSWSWVFLKGRIRYMSAEYGGRREFELVSSEASPVGADPYGDVQAGCHIVLRGRAVAFRFSMYDDVRQSEGYYPVGITIEEDNGWYNAACTRSKQDVEICEDITAAEWVWKATDKVGSGMETMERIKGFDTTTEYGEYFDLEGPERSDAEAIEYVSTLSI